MSTTSFKLKNGLPVLLIENHRSPVVSVQMWVKTGSADERKTEEGISHFIEHLVFKGTKQFGVGEIAATVEGSGGELNAYTSFDQTVFYVTISKEFTSTALTVISEMMGFPLFDAKEIDNEREVVIEEIKRSNDSPGRCSSQLLFGTCYKKHPYGIPVIGFDRIIRKVSRKKLVDYYNSRYVPSNMLLVVAGAFDRAQIKKQITPLFSQLASHPLRRVKRASEATQKISRIATATAPFEEAHLHLAWPIPGAKHKDVAALDVLAMILGQGESSRLVQALRLKNSCVNSIGAGSFTPKDQGLFTVSATLNPENLALTLNKVGAELGRIMREHTTPVEMQRAVTNMESEEFYGLETVDGLARKAGQLETLMGDHKYFKKFMQRIYGTTSADVLRVARKYLAPERLSLIIMCKENKKLIDKQAKMFIDEYRRIYKSSAANRAGKQAGRGKYKRVNINSAVGQLRGDPAVQRVPLKNGATLLFRHDKSVPTISVRAAFLGGLRAEGDGKSGATELLSRVWTSGTKTLSELDIIHRVESMAGGLSGFGGRNTAGLSMQMLSPFEQEAAGLFADVLQNTELSEETVTREKTILLEQIKSKHDHPGHICSQMFSEVMFQGHPYAHDMLGTSESVAGLGVGDIDRHRIKMLSAANMMLVVSGNADSRLWKQCFEAAAGGLPPGKKLNQRFVFSGPVRDERRYFELKKEQSHIILGYRGITLDDKRRFTLQVMQSILAGQGGRLFIELRDKASLAYSVSPVHLEGIDAGYFGAYIGCSPEKGKTAVRMLQEEFKKLAESAPNAAELARAKRYLIGRHDIDLQRNSSIGSALLFNEIYGIPAEEVFLYPQRIAAVTADDIRNFAAETFAQPCVAVAVGPESPW